MVIRYLDKSWSQVMVTSHGHKSWSKIISTFLVLDICSSTSSGTDIDKGLCTGRSTGTYTGTGKGTGHTQIYSKLTVQSLSLSC